MKPAIANSTPAAISGGPVLIGSVDLNLSEPARPIKLDLKFYPFTEDEKDFAPKADGFPSTKGEAGGNRDGERQFFTKLIFHLEGRTYTFDSKNTLMSFTPPGTHAEPGDDFAIPGLTFDKSNFFQTGTYRDAKGPHRLLFFEGWGYASDARASLIIGFRNDGTPFKVLEQETFEVTEFLAPTSDQPAQIVGKPTLSQISSSAGEYSPERPYATTYDPFAVYLISDAETPATYSLKQSRVYNLKNYVWHGPSMSEKYAVFYNLPGHSAIFGAPLDRADQIFKAATPSK